MCALISLLSVLPFTTPRYAVEVERDVVYARVQGYWSHAPVGERGTFRHQAPLLRATRPLDLDMDIYLPADDDPSARRPLLLMMHGGSFFVGNKEEMGQAGWCEFFAKLGYVAVSVNYRLGFRPTRQDVEAAEQRALEDVDAALRYLLDRDDLRIDPDHLFAAGTSAGAMLALRLAFREGEHPRIRAVGNFWGSVHDLKVLEAGRAAILSFQSPDDPVMPYGRGYPFRTGQHRFQPPTQWFSEEMYGTQAVHEEALRLGLRAEHHACPEARHRLHIADDGTYTERFFEIRDRMAAFFAEEFRDLPSAPDRR